MKIYDKYLSTKKPNDNFIWWLYRKCMSHIPMYVKYKNRFINEHRKSYGIEHSENTFYVIRPNGKSCGLMSLISHILLGLKYADSRGYIPIIDFKNYSNMYRTGVLFRDNSFENYFIQPCYELKYIRKAKNVIIGSINYEQLKDNYDSPSIKEMNKYLSMIKYTKKVNDYINEEYVRIHSLMVNSNSRILGVLGRGTDYSSLRPHKHAVVPTIDVLLNKTDELLCEWGNFDYIFLATEDEEILSSFIGHYGRKLLYCMQERYVSNTHGKALSQIHKKRKNDNFYRGLEYLSTIDFLSKCDSLIASDVGGARVATWMNNEKYDNVYIFDLGTYE